MRPRSVEMLLGMSKAKLFDNSELSKVLGPSLNDRIPRPADFQEGILTCSHSINPGQKPQLREPHTARYCYYYLCYMEEETGPEAPQPPPRLWSINDKGKDPDISLSKLTPPFRALLWLSEANQRNLSSYTSSYLHCILLH